MATKKKEKPFSRLNKAEKRKAICLDVLAQIKAKTIMAQRGTYVRTILRDNDLAWEEEESIKNSQLNKLIQTNKVTCKACALGSMFLGHVNKTNHCTFNRANQEGSVNMRERLGKIFYYSRIGAYRMCF